MKGFGTVEVRIPEQRPLVMGAGALLLNGFCGSSGSYSPAVMGGGVGGRHDGGAAEGPCVAAPSLLMIKLPISHIKSISPMLFG